MYRLRPLGWTRVHDRDDYCHRWFYGSHDGSTDMGRQWLRCIHIRSNWASDDGNDTGVTVIYSYDANGNRLWRQFGSVLGRVARATGVVSTGAKRIGAARVGCFFAEGPRMKYFKDLRIDAGAALVARGSICGHSAYAQTFILHQTPSTTVGL